MWVQGVRSKLKIIAYCSSRTSKQGCLHLTVKLGCATLANSLTLPSDSGAGPPWCQNKCGSCKPWVGRRFFEMNISLTFYCDLSRVRSVQPHLLGPKIAFSCWSFLRLESFFSEKGILPTHSLPSPTSSEINASQQLGAGQ